MKYFGKRYLHKFLIEKGFNPPKMKEFEYKRYRGDEFLDNDLISVFSINKKKILVKEFEYNEEKDKYCEISSRSYVFVVDNFLLIYENIRGKIKIW